LQLVFVGKRMLVDLSLQLPEIEDARYLPSRCPICESAPSLFLTIPKQFIVYECGGSYEFRYNQENRKFWNARGKCDSPPHDMSFIRIIKEAERIGCLNRLYYAIRVYMNIGDLRTEHEIIKSDLLRYNNIEI
jgi:hypothetical protein